MRRRSSIAGALLAFLVVLVALALIGGGCAISGYNKAIRLDEDVSNKWAQVENILQSRYDSIPNIVETVKGYAKHEQDIFNTAAEARTKYFQAAKSGNRAEKAQAATGYESVLSRLLMLRESYPDPKAQAGFLKLQDTLEGTERRLAVERKRFNEAVKALNTYRRSFFGRTFCSWAAVEAAEYFEVAEQAKALPRVKFSDD